MKPSLQATVMELNALAEKYSCDKLYFHSYIPFYSRLFHGRTVRVLVEIGIGYEELMAPLVPRYIHGSSLKMWKDFFPEARIIGCDIREDVLFQEDRIECLQVDQTCKEDLMRLAAFKPDVIIDDGSHRTEDQIFTAQVLLPCLRPEGLYVIEDVKEPEKVIKAVGGMWVQFPKRNDDCMVVIKP